VTLRLLLVTGAAWVLIAAPLASAQHDGAASDSVPDVPAGPGRLIGAIVNPDAPDRVGGVDVLLYALPAGGTPGLRRGVSDAGGRFVFEGISNDPKTAYLIGARYAGVPYPGERVSFAEGTTEVAVDVRVGEPSESAADVVVTESQIELAWMGGRLGVAELVHFENRGARTAFVAAERRARAAPLYHAALPAGAEDFQIPLGIQPEGLVRDGADLRFYGPLYPSAWPGPLAREQGLAFQYTLPAADGPTRIEKRFPSGATRVVVVVPATGPKVAVAGAREEVAAAPEGAEPAAAASAPKRLVVEGVPRDGRVVLELDVPASRVDADAVHLLETRIFLEIDDAALQVQEEHTFRVDGQVPVVAPPGAALLAIPLPRDAANVRFDRDAFALGLVPGEGEGAQLAGPIPPGETKLQIAYHLPVAAGGTVFEKRVGRTLPLLSIFVADTGLRLESERLHRKRPVRTPDRSYLALEAFQIEPSETVALAIEPLAAPAQLPRAALLAMAAIAAAGIALFVVAPLRGRGAAPESIEPEVDAALREREAVYAALRDLEHDHETAKLSDADYESMRAELRARAAASLRAQQAADAKPLAAREPAGGACPHCGAPARGGDRFCPQCGGRLEDAARARA
jgi:hypothetical protein